MDDSASSGERAVEGGNGSAGARELDALPHKPAADSFLLRGLVQCGLCDAELVTVVALSGVRKYDCPTGRCAQRPVPAEELEQLVWQRFVRLNELAACGVKRNERQAAMRQVLRRVRVHDGLIDLWFEWRS